MSQAGLLAQRDSLSPFRVVLAISCVSLVGDLLLIGRLGMGVVGAAWTTVAAQARHCSAEQTVVLRSALPCAAAQCLLAGILSSPLLFVWLQTLPIA